jgi:hypothetical protein
VLLAIIAAALSWGVFASPLAQPQDYHRFADARVLLAIDNAADTLSNLAFLAVGAMGLAFLRRERRGSARFASPQEMWPYYVFFFGVALTSAGSAYYHLAPDDARLVWDRLPMTIAFMSLLAAVVGERISVAAATRLLLPAVLLGLASVVYWRASALAGAENLRPYLAVQFGSIAVILTIALLYPSRYTHGNAIFWVAAGYGAAKVLEVYDREVYALGQVASGHTLKHLVAATCIVLILRSLARRTLISPGLSPSSARVPVSA